MDHGVLPTPQVPVGGGATVCDPAKCRGREAAWFSSAVVVQHKGIIINMYLAALTSFAIRKHAGETKWYCAILAALFLRIA